MYEFLLRYRVFTRLFFFVILSVCLITTQLRILDNVILFFFSPVEKALIYFSDGLDSFFHRYYMLLMIEGEYRKLRQQNEELKGKLITIEEKTIKLEHLEELLNFTQTIPFQTMAARVIGKSPISPNSTLIIDKGATDGMKKFQGVINHLGVIGRIIGVSNNAAFVQMVNDKNCSMAAINQRTRDHGLIRGLGFNFSELQMSFVYYRAQLQLGDTIITSGLDNVFPKGLLIGTVTELEKSKNDLFYEKVSIKPANNFNTIEEVLVVIAPDSLENP
ncbi:rod shape-determining protein MreC [candidate division CSSED10-310 bacterium]|uniref:Cell shape-determining protein MreC n=1 Tax=candidate division CSSED10-310 bacterium TaxID=2855610 RepID=A0ABV6Z6C3_UNCC1